MRDFEIYGEKTWLTGAGHGYVGNVFPVLRSREILGDELYSCWADSIAQTVTLTARRANGLANWPPSIGKARKGRKSLLVQQCQGTSGNGYALLKMYHLTGDELWLKRARQFAASAIEQRHELIGAGVDVNSNLWDGGLGLALYLADCLEGKAEFPTLDYF